MTSTEPVTAGATLKRTLWPIGGCYALIVLTFALPAVDSTRAPYFDLTSDFARAANLISASGTTPWVIAVAAFMYAVLLTRPGLTSRRRAREAWIVAAAIVLSAGAGASLNEHLLKETLDVPRPNILALAAHDGPLGMTAEEYYALGDKAARSVALAAVLARQPPGFQLDAAIREHWIKESGYSRPSGHAFAAFFFATFFLALAHSRVSGTRRRVFYLLLPWAVAVCYSRPILRVHTPFDITLGGLLGIALAAVTFMLVHRLLARPDDPLARSGA